MTLPLLLTATLVAPTATAQGSSPDTPDPASSTSPSNPASDDPWLRSSAARASTEGAADTSGVLLWKGDWRQLDLASTMAHTAGGIAALTPPDGPNFTVTIGSLVGSPEQSVSAIRPGRVELLAHTDRDQLPWCVVALQLQTGEPLRDDRGRVTARGRIATAHETVACASTPSQALQQALDQTGARIAGEPLPD